MPYRCPCCGYRTLEEEPPDTYDICDVCGWEDDGIQFENPDYRRGANRPSLREARESFARIGGERAARPRVRATAAPG